VTKTVGTNFSAADVGNWIVYDDGDHERISAYISTSQVTVETTTVRTASTAAFLHGPKNAKIFHKKKKIHILFIDSRLFYCTNVNIDSWTEIYKSGIEAAPESDVSRIRPYDDYAVLFNSGGMYKIDLVNFMYWRMNGAVPTVRITDVAQTLTKTYGRNYVYAVGRLTGASQTKDRYTTGIEIQQETGTVSVDASLKDYGSVFTSRPVGEGDTTYGRLTGGALSYPYNTSAGWKGIADGKFGITINGTEKQCSADFTTCTSMSDVAYQIQLGLRDYFPTATCEWVDDHFVIESPDEGGTVTYTTAGVGAYTDISTLMGTQDGLTPAAATSTPLFTEPVTIGELELPIDSVTEYYDAQHDIYSVYSTLDIGPSGTDPVTGEGNNSQLLIWQADVPVAKAFVASLAAYTITATEGTFQKCDKGCKFRFLDGTEVTLDAYVSASSFTSTTTGTIASQPAAIGGDNALSKAIRVMTASQEGVTVTRTAGSVFSAADVGRPIFWPTGLKSNITAYVSANQVTVKESATIASTGCCIEPKTRKYTDVIREEVSGILPNLRTRITSYSLQNRFFTPMPNCNMGEITANMLWGIVVGESIVYYCSTDVNYRYQAGYYYESKQREIFQDAIYEISEVSDSLSVKCNHSTRAIQINSFSSYKIDAAGTAIITVSGQSMVDERIGVKYFGGVLPIDRSKQLVITAEPAIRMFNGSGYGDNLADTRIQRILEGCQAAYAMSYDSVNGATIWLLEE
jgi:hypothetical protein